MGKATSGALTLQQKYELLRKKQAEKVISKKGNEVSSVEENAKLIEILNKRQQEQEAKIVKPNTIKLPSNLQRALKKDPSVLQRREVKPVVTEEVRKNTWILHSK